MLEIGFGMGETTAEIARLRPEDDFVGIEVHSPGVGSLLRRIADFGLTNVRVIRHDAVEAVAAMIPPDSLAGIHVFFPDPWPKKRHHKRRLLKAPFVHELALRLAHRGYLHVATDWEAYAHEILATLAAEPLLENSADGFAPRPDYRPLTKFEARGLKLGHERLGPAFPSPMIGSAPAMPNAAVLHITSAAGGGSDRYVRDLAASALRPHYVLHAAAGTDVLEMVDARRFAPLRDLTSAESDAGAIARWLQSSNIGILHLHGVDQVCRAHLDALQRARTLPYLVTLHDLQFVNPRAFDAIGMPEPDPDWIIDIKATLERAATVIAPSAFILDVRSALRTGHPRGDHPAGVAPGRHERGSLGAGGLRRARAATRRRRRRRARTAQGQRRAAVARDGACRTARSGSS